MPSVAYADSFGEGGGTGTLGYYLASAFEQIYVQQNGLVSFTGMLYCFCLHQNKHPGQPRTACLQLTTLSVSSCMNQPLLCQLGTGAGIAGVDSCSCSVTPSIVLKRLLLCAHVACFCRFLLLWQCSHTNNHVCYALIWLAKLGSCRSQCKHPFLAWLAGQMAGCAPGICARGVQSCGAAVYRQAIQQSQSRGHTGAAPKLY